MAWSFSWEKQTTWVTSGNFSRSAPLRTWKVTMSSSNAEISFFLPAATFLYFDISSHVLRHMSLINEKSLVESLQVHRIFLRILSTFKYREGGTNIRICVETLRGPCVGLNAHTTCRVWLSDKDANFINNRGLSRACFVVRPVSAPRTCRSTSARGRKKKDPIRSIPWLCNSAPSHSMLGLLTHYSITILELHKTEGLPLTLRLLMSYIYIYIWSTYSWCF